MVPESKEETNKLWGHVKRTQKPNGNSYYWPNLGQPEQQNQ